ncbi:MAG: hypothetical protein FWF52_06465 [Candidatus Azobacteroides sp.]|nr:hypothetical protein [Candidatus Azobacteroides sp.]
MVLMLKNYCILFLIFTSIYTSSVFSQEMVWKANVRSFFDNTEFGRSSVQMSQTMAGVHLAPEIGLSWQNKHRIFAGVDILHEYGSNKAIDYYDPVIYYEYDGKPFRFYMGAFPRRGLLDQYPRMFFQDSIQNYRPVLNGFFWEIYSDKNYANIWLDWVGRQTSQQRESFFMGWSGRYQRGPFYAEHLAYMFHFAKTMKADTTESVHDNGLLLTSLGVDLASAADFEVLEAKVGWSMGLDRDRDAGVWNKPQGLLSELKIEYRGLGLFNTYYKGGRQQAFYNAYSNQLYWGDPIYRSKEYNRADFYIQLIHSSVVKLKFIYSFHSTEKSLYQSQALYASFDLNNLSNKKNEQKYRYLWDNWF